MSAVRRHGDSGETAEGCGVFGCLHPGDGSGLQTGTGEPGDSFASMAAPLTTDLDHDDAVPYFLWDQPMTVRELRERLATASKPERSRLLAKVLREARDPDVWRFTTPESVLAQWQDLAPHLGRRRRFWEFLLRAWQREGLIGGE